MMRNRTHSPKQNASALVLRVFALLLAGFCAQSFSLVAGASELHGILENNLGVNRFTKKHPVEAFNYFNNALADLSFSPQVHFNMATTFLENKEFEKALSEYQLALRYASVRGFPAPDRDSQRIQFSALFNSGIALTELKRTEEAIASYQMALELVPNSVETKTNIELLAKQSEGGGEGEDKDKQDQKDNKDNKDGKGKDKKDDKNKDSKDDKDDKDQKKPKDQPQSGPTPKPTPRPFKSEQLSQQDVGRILEELKRQEDQIRAKMQRDGAKDAPRDKDW